MLVFLLLYTIALLKINAMSGQRQGLVSQAIKGGSEALVMNILLLLLGAILGSSLNAQAQSTPGNLIMLHVIQILYVMLRSLSLRQQQRWTHLKALVVVNILIVLSVYLFLLLVQSIGSID